MTVSNGLMVKAPTAFIPRGNSSGNQCSAGRGGTLDPGRAQCRIAGGPSGAQSAAVARPTVRVQGRASPSLAHSALASRLGATSELRAKSAARFRPGHLCSLDFGDYRHCEDETIEIDVPLLRNWVSCLPPQAKELKRAEARTGPAIRHRYARAPLFGCSKSL